MSSLTEITSLLTQIAFHIQQKGLPLVNDEGSFTPAISSLNQSLNPNEESRVRVLDTALSLMCFEAPQVFDSEIECLVETIVSVLSSSVSCKVLRFEREEFLEIGSSISRYDCEELIEACSDVSGKLKGHGMLLHLLLDAVLRVTISTSCHQSLFPLPPILNAQPNYQNNSAVSKLHSLLPEEISASNHELPSRLILWYLDPLSLRHDISMILWESAKRPFLCLKQELHEKLIWRSIILCLVLSPTMFIETRTILHNWFVVTGLACILELKIEIVSAVLDVLARPMWWGFPMEVGSKLPFSRAYFPNFKHHLLVTLAGPVSCESFLDLIHLISGLVSSFEKHSKPTFKKTSNKARMINHKSTWALLMEFPVWFFFAVVLLFSGKNYQDTLRGRCTSGAFKAQTTVTDEYCAAAARYLAWLLSPANEYHSDLLVDCLIKISRSWALKQGDMDRHKDATTSKKKLRKPNKDNFTAKVYGGHAMGLWLKEFHDYLVRYWNKLANSSDFTGTEAPKLPSPRQSLLFTRIPLGILIMYPCVDEEACKLLLHYAATGSILPSKETLYSEQNPLKQKSKGYEDLITFSEKCDERKEAITGASLVFSLSDVMEELLDSAFETEESGENFISQLKLKTGGFLVKCVEKLLQITTDEDDDGMVMLMDLQKRLLRWRHQGREIEGYNKALDDVVSTLNCKISSVMKDK